MIRLFLPLLAAAVAAGIFQGADAQTLPGPAIGSRTVVFTAGDTLGNSSSFEARISANSSFIVPTVLVEANSSGSSPIIDISEWRIYDSSGTQFSLTDVDGPLAASENQVRSIAGSDVLPLGVPQDGSLGIVFEVPGMSKGDQVKVTFVYTANAGSSATSRIVPAALELPFAVEGFELQTMGQGLTVADSFVDPENHCEICTIVRYTPEQSGNASAAYITGETDLTGAQELVFWARGDNGNETATFNAAGKAGDNGTIVWANATSLKLGTDWKRYEIGLEGADLADVTHLFGFEVRGDSLQTFYVKGASYN